MQNKVIRASLFLPRSTPIDLLYSKFQTLKLKDMINMEFAKFFFKFKNNMLPSSFNNYFINLHNVHKYNTRQKSKSGYFHQSFASEFGRKRLHHTCLKVWESIPLTLKDCSFLQFKKKLWNHYCKSLSCKFFLISFTLNKLLFSPVSFLFSLLQNMIIRFLSRNLHDSTYFFLEIGN